LVAAGDELAGLARQVHHPERGAPARRRSTRSAPSSADACHRSDFKARAKAFFALDRLARPAIDRSAVTQQPRPGNWRFRSGTIAAVRTGDETDERIGIAALARDDARAAVHRRRPIAVLLGATASSWLLLRRRKITPVSLVLLRTLVHFHRVVLG
jgi:hypothetical protein